MTPDQFRSDFALSQGIVTFKVEGVLHKAKVNSVIPGHKENSLLVMATGESGQRHMLYTSEIESVS